MEMPKIIVIVGPTASGKTALSVELALRLNGEILSADSRQVYRGLDIGAGKITKDEMRGIPHHLLDVADLKDTYTVSDFVRDGRNAVGEIVERKKLPIIVGGTFFYVDALLGRISTPPVPPNLSLRAYLETLTLEELDERLRKTDSARADAITEKNPRRLIRAIEIAETMGNVPPIERNEHYDALTLGVSIKKEDLHRNIHDRLLSRIQAGMIEEVDALLKSGITPTRLEALGLEYRYVTKFLIGELSKEDMIHTLETKIRQFAKRQMTWLKRDTTIVWVKPDEMENIEEVVRRFLT